VRALAATRVNYGHELVYRLITGSQISLLLAANTPSPPDVMGAQAIYEQAKNMFPDMYKQFSFDVWLRYPIHVGLLRYESLIPNQPAVYRITTIGQDFLHYLVNNGLTAMKPG
jgi:hypothetical protein